MNTYKITLESNNTTLDIVSADNATHALEIYSDNHNGDGTGYTRGGLKRDEHNMSASIRTDGGRIHADIATKAVYLDGDEYVRVFDGETFEDVPSEIYPQWLDAKDNS